MVRPASPRSDLALLLALVAAAACGSVARPVEQITLDDTHVLVLGGQGRSSVVMGDERDLFDEAVRAYERDDLQTARRIYAALLEAHPGSRWRDLYAFNRGLVAMRLEDFRGAARDFEAAEAWARTSADARDARFHAAIAWAGLGQWHAAARALEELLVTVSVPAERVELLVRAGICRQQAGHHDAARAHYREAVHLQAETSDLYLQYHPTWAARAQYQVGDLLAWRSAAIPLLLPLERMRVDLEAKARLLLNAQNAFLKAIRMRDHYWALAAGYRIGQSYEDFMADLNAAEVPAELDAEAREVYFDELRRHVAPLVRRAIDVHRKNVEMARRVRADNEWVQKSEASLQKLEALLATLPPPDGRGGTGRGAP